MSWYVMQHAWNKESLTLNPETEYCECLSLQATHVACYNIVTLDSARAGLDVFVTTCCLSVVLKT